MRSSVTVVLSSDASTHDTDVLRTLESLAQQSAPVEYELLSSEALDANLVERSGLRPVRQVTRTGSGRPDLAGCTGEWVALVAAGDRWPKERFSGALEMSRGFDVLYGDVVLAERGTPTTRRFGELVVVPPPEELLARLVEQCCVPRSSLMVRRVAWEQVGATPNAGTAWDLDLLLRLAAGSSTFRRLEDNLPVVDYPTAWTQEQRLRFLLDADAVFGAIAERFGPLEHEVYERRARGFAELLAFSRYQGLSRANRLSVLSLAKVHRSMRTAAMQLAAALLPNVVRHYQAQLANLRPQTTPFDLLAGCSLHDCSHEQDSLCRRAPLVTIAVSCYNYGRFLGAAIDSALAQTYRNVEVVVVDDGSTDETPDVVATYGDAIRPFRQENAGIAAAHNLAASVANGAFVTYLDADDTLHPLYVQELLGAFCRRESDASLGFVYSQMQIFEREHRITWYPDFNVDSLGYGNYVNSAALVKREVLRDASFDPSFPALEDWDFFLTLIDHGWRGQLIDLPLLRYRKHSESTSRSDDLRWRSGPGDVRASIRAKHALVRRRPLIRRGRMFEAYVR